MIRHPQMTQTKGQQVSAFSEAVDLMPTVMEHFLGSASTYLDGRSLLPFLAGDIPDHWRQSVQWEFDFRDIAQRRNESYLGLDQRNSNLAVIMDQDFKYVHCAGLPPLLFDMKNDPGELHNLAEDPAFLSIRLRYAEKLLTWRAEHLDQRLAFSELTAEGLVSV